jgi:hypothetical protein
MQQATIEAECAEPLARYKRIHDLTGRKAVVRDGIFTRHQAHLMAVYVIDPCLDLSLY